MYLCVAQQKEAAMTRGSDFTFVTFLRLATNDSTFMFKDVSRLAHKLHIRESALNARICKLVKRGVLSKGQGDRGYYVYSWNAPQEPIAEKADVEILPAIHFSFGGFSAHVDDTEIVTGILQQLRFLPTDRKRTILAEALLSTEKTSQRA